jgi:hypothetical protein
MANYAVMSGNVVVNVIIANTLQDAQLVTNDLCIEYTEENPAGIGWTYDEETHTFNPPQNQTNVNNPKA